MPALSRLEHILTSPVRQSIKKTFTPNQIRYGAFCLSLMTCILDASVVTFSLFTSKFIHHLGYTQVDINVISGTMLLGLYLTLPLLGYLADAHGSVLLALIGLSLTPGYLGALWVYKAHGNYCLMAIAFGFIGLGTSSSYFCSLLTCAKVFPNRKGLSISLPVTFYGLSSLVLTWAFHLPFFTDPKDGSISIDKVFHGLAILYAIVGLVNWVSSVVVSLEKEIVFAQLIDEERRTGEYGTSEDTGAVLNAPLVNETSHEEKFKAFLNDKSMTLVLLALFLLAGPLELYISNLGSIVGALGRSENDIGKQVSMFSFFSTLTRLSMGVLSDRFNSCGATVSLILIFGVGVSLLGFSLIAVGYPYLDIISLLVGLGYGTVFTLFPTLSAMVWGIEILGSTWGLFLSAPAIGALVFGLFYAHEYELHCPEVGCLKVPFIGFSIFFIMSGICLSMGWAKFWRWRS